MKTYLKNSVIYQVYVRNFTKEGTFNALKQKLDYIKNLKVDILYLLPISPIGKEGRKGDLGSPYSISDYTKINPELGTLEDFKSLIEATHNHDMKIMIDIVFNHTSRDSYIAKNHPEWMYHNKEGKMANKVGDWSDVYDLDYSNPALIKYLVDVIQYYCSIGVDGFRFDVASLIPKEFYIDLKKMLPSFANKPNFDVWNELIAVAGDVLGHTKKQRAYLAVCDKKTCGIIITNNNTLKIQDVQQTGKKSP